MKESAKNITYVSLDTEEKYDFDKIHNIIEALDFLRLESIKTGNEEIQILINSTFNICFTAYYLALRGNTMLRPLTEN